MLCLIRRKEKSVGNNSRLILAALRQRPWRGEAAHAESHRSRRFAGMCMFRKREREMRLRRFLPVGPSAARAGGKTRGTVFVWEMYRSAKRHFHQSLSLSLALFRRRRGSTQVREREARLLQPHGRQHWASDQRVR